MRLEAPPRIALLKESRVLVEMTRMLYPLAFAPARPANSKPDGLIIVVPGFGADDRYTAPLRNYLRRQGYTVEGWGMGRNDAGLNLPHSVEALSDGWPVEARDNYRGEAAVPYLCDRFSEYVAARISEDGRPVSLIGWSLGGCIAREAARDLPESVRHVITLGAPVIGGPKYTATGKYFRKRGMDLDWIEESVRRREALRIQQPVSAIYSRSDGVVAWPAALDHHNENVRHIEVKSSHLGMIYNPTVWREISSELDRVTTSG